MGGKTQRRGVQAKVNIARKHWGRKNRQDKTIKFHDYAGASVPLHGVCPDCGRALETEDELLSGHCLPHIPDEHSIHCPIYNAKINRGFCETRRNMFNNSLCSHCQNPADDKPLNGFKGLAWGLAISAIFWAIFFVVKGSIQ